MKRETKLKTVGDCIGLCKAAGIKISHADDNLFEVAGAIEGLLDKVAALEGENAALKTHVEKGWIDLLDKVKHRVPAESPHDEGWNMCVHYLDHIAFETMSKVNVQESLAQHDEQVAFQALESNKPSP